MPSIRITFNSGATFDLPINPDLEIRSKNIYDEITQPPAIVAVDEEWTCSSAYLTGVDAAATIAAWNTLDALVRGSADQLVRIVLRNAGADARVLGGTGFDEFKALELSASPSPGGFTNNVQYQLVASARRKVANALQIRRQIAITYDPAGLSTQRVSGEILTRSGTSATAQAVVLGAQTAPSNFFGFQTNGPGGVDVTTLDGVADTRATFESVLREFGEALPSGVSNLEHTIETMIQGGETITRTRVRAHGAGALTAMQSSRFRPAGSLFTSTVTEDRAGRIASAEYVQRDLSETEDRFSIRRSFEIVGSGRPIQLLPITGAHNPILQGGRISGSIVTEHITVQARGVSSPSDLPIPNPPPSLLPYHDPAVREDAFSLAERGNTQDADLYRRTVTRTYRVPGKIDRAELMELAIIRGKITTGKSDDGGDGATEGGGGGGGGGSATGGVAGGAAAVNGANRLINTADVVGFVAGAAGRGLLLEWGRF